MAKTLIVGDLHCKMSLVLPEAFNAAIANQCDSIVLTGDLCDEWGVDGGAMVRELEFTAQWKKQVEDSGIGVVFLLGNHESAYIGLPQYHFTNRVVSQRVGEILRKDLGVRMAIAVQGFLVSHAGLTSDWALRNGFGPYCSADDAAQRLCDIFADSEDRLELAACGPRRGGWESPGPLWADRRELAADPYGGFSQIVGHTPVESVEQCVLDDGNELWLADTFSLRPTGGPIGDASALLVGDDGIGSVSLFSDWGEVASDFCPGEGKGCTGRP